MYDHKAWHNWHCYEVRWNSGFYNNQNKTCWKHGIPLPNVVPGACGLRVTGTTLRFKDSSRNWPKNTVTQRDFKIHEELEYSHPNNLTCIWSFYRNKETKITEKKEVFVFWRLSQITFSFMISF